MAEQRSGSDAPGDEDEGPVEGAGGADAGGKPPLRRSQIVKARKSQLVEWARAHGLNTSGKKAEVRDRLLQYMDEFQVIEEAEPGAPPEPEPEAAVPAPAPAAEEAEAAPEPEPAVEEIPEEGPPEAEAVEPLEEVAPEELPEEAEERKEADLEAELEAEIEAEGEGPPLEEERLPEEWEEAAPEEAAVEAPAEPVAPEPEPQPAIVTAPPKVAPVPELKPAPVEAAMPAPPAAIEKALACPTCGAELTFIAKYDRLYCYACGNYAPRGFGKEALAPPPAAPEPARPAVVAVPEVKPAPPPVARPPEPKVVPKVEHPCPTCGAELKYVREWDRWYCYAERKYAPKDYGKPVRNPCPTCGKELKFIAQYNRWYCHHEGKYAPRTYIPTGPAVAAAAPVAAPTAPALRAESPSGLGAASVTAPAAAVVTHAHGRPGGAVALVATGFALLLVVRLLVSLLPAMGYNPLAGVDPVLVQQVLPLLEFLGVLLAMVGVVVGLLAVRGR